MTEMILQVSVQKIIKLIDYVTFDNDLRALTASLRSSSNVEECTRSHSRSTWTVKYQTGHIG